MRISTLCLLLIFGYPAFSQCNGSQNLCQKRYDEVAYLTTHNAFNAQEQGFTFPNQNYGLTQQLDDGVRALMLDVYTLFGIPTVYHGTSILGNEPLSNNLIEIKQFLDANPNEIVTIILECYVSANIIESELDNVGMLNYLYTKPQASNWDYLQDMIDNNTRLVILTDQDDASTGQEWYHYAWDHCVETHFTVNDINDFNNGYNRGDSINDLFIFNHFVTDPLIGIGMSSESAVVNEYIFLMPRIQQHFNEKGKFPNFITLDFYDLGDGKTVVDSLNSPSFVVGIEELDFEKIQIKPNPSSGFVTINNLDKNQNCTVLLFNALGEKQLELNSLYSPELTIDLSHLKSGIYLVQVRNDLGSVSNQRLIVN